MTEHQTVRHERAFVESIAVEIAGGSQLFGRDIVCKLLACYRRECERFDDLAQSVAYDIEQDETHLLTIYGEFTVGLMNGEAEADTIAMRDQIDRYAKADKERRDAK